VPFNQVLQSQSDWSLFNRTRQKRRREQENWVRLEFGEMTLQTQ